MLDKWDRFFTRLFDLPPMRVWYIRLVMPFMCLMLSVFFGLCLYAKMFNAVIMADPHFLYHKPRNPNEVRVQCFEFFKQDPISRQQDEQKLAKLEKFLKSLQPRIPCLTKDCK